jgi:hypothetical protein
LRQLINDFVRANVPTICVREELMQAISYLRRLVALQYLQQRV